MGPFGIIAIVLVVLSVSAIIILAFVLWPAQPASVDFEESIQSGGSDESSPVSGGLTTVDTTSASSSVVSQSRVYEDVEETVEFTVESGTFDGYPLYVSEVRNLVNRITVKDTEIVSENAVHIVHDTTTDDALIQSGNMTTTAFVDIAKVYNADNPLTAYMVYATTDNEIRHYTFSTNTDVTLASIGGACLGFHFIYDTGYYYLHVATSSDIKLYKGDTLETLDTGTVKLTAPGSIVWAHFILHKWENAYLLRVNFKDTLKVYGATSDSPNLDSNFTAATVPFAIEVSDQWAGLHSPLINTDSEFLVDAEVLTMDVTAFGYVSHVIEWYQNGGASGSIDSSGWNVAAMTDTTYSVTVSKNGDLYRLWCMMDNIIRWTEETSGALSSATTTWYTRDLTEVDPGYNNPQYMLYDDVEDAMQIIVGDGTDVKRYQRVINNDETKASEPTLRKTYAIGRNVTRIFQVGYNQGHILYSSSGSLYVMQPKPFLAATIVGPQNVA